MAGGIWLRPVAAKLMVMVSASTTTTAAADAIVNYSNCNRKCHCHHLSTSIITSCSSTRRGSHLHLHAAAQAVSSSSSSVEAERTTMVSSSGAFYVLDGMPHPLGPSPSDAGIVKGVNFALYSSNASAVSLCLFTLDHLHANKITDVIPLDPVTNRTGNVWHVLLSPRNSNNPNPNPDPDPNPYPNPDLNFKLEDMVYAYQLNGHFCPHQGRYFDSSNILLDPYAKVILVLILILILLSSFFVSFSSHTTMSSSSFIVIAFPSIAFILIHSF